MGLLPYGASFIFVLPDPCTYESSCLVTPFSPLIFCRTQTWCVSPACKDDQWSCVHTNITLESYYTHCFYRVGLLFSLYLLVGLFWVHPYHIPSVMEFLSGEFQILEVDPWTLIPILDGIGTFSIPLLTYVLIKPRINRVTVPSLDTDAGIKIDYI